LGYLRRRRILKIHETFQRGIEKAFFRGKSTRSSVYTTYAIGNVLLMVVLFYVLLNTILYNWTGQLYPVTSGYRLLLGGLDDAIPFIPEMVIFYRYLFYGIVILTMLYFAFVEYKKGYALGWSLVIINAIAIVIYIILPVSTYPWRQALIPKLDMGNFWQAQVYEIYTTDTPFNCFPSLHAAVSTICFYTWYEYSKARPSWATKVVAAASFVIAAGIVLSTLFIKQHYIVDEIFGIVLAWAVGRVLFKSLWKPLKTKELALKEKRRHEK
jgi:membrane-associated phospholipid phosphatase